MVKWGSSVCFQNWAVVLRLWTLKLIVPASSSARHEASVQQRRQVQRQKTIVLRYHLPAWLWACILLGFLTSIFVLRCTAAVSMLMLWGYPVLATPVRGCAGAGSAKPASRIMAMALDVWMLPPLCATVAGVYCSP
jgi:hypothetical protein